MIRDEEFCDDRDDAFGCFLCLAFETGWTCSGEPSECYPVCGDGLKLEQEECDDSNILDGDGCSSLCIIEVKTE